MNVAIIGQVNDALNALIQALKDQKLVNIDAWWKQIEQWRSVDSMAYQTKSGGSISI
jgi:acetolactate synthase-1/2/3 large subunit